MLQFLGGSVAAASAGSCPVDIADYSHRPSDRSRAGIFGNVVIGAAADVVATTAAAGGGGVANSNSFGNVVALLAGPDAERRNLTDIVVVGVERNNFACCSPDGL